jgi:hypothetical protein
MSRRFLLGTFEREEDIIEVTRASRARGFKIVDVYTPYAVHGLDRAGGLRPSRLPWVCFYLGLFGAAFKVWFEFWTTGSAWPINVGGKPWNSLPAFVPVTFEVMVLFAGVSTVIAFLIASRLRPGKQARMPDLRVTDDRFVLVLEQTDAAFDPEEVGRFFRSFGAAAVEEREEEVE